ncbi:ATP-dependent RNA helicase DOB1 [Ceratobasidium sp. AG-Ba]|nr:ATP-dependent RNA helicase DOB1 [Ceratobasidium sp. AG-Ba]QRW11305.1 ATP-dependent RNA helicase DOB1 [Ceratobasidium sp. AG-Ba]
MNDSNQTQLSCSASGRNNNQYDTHEDQAPILPASAEPTHKAPSPSFVENHKDSTPPQSAASLSSLSLAEPRSFQIGGKHIGASELVTVEDIRAHLAFLGAFAKLKESVRSQSGPDIGYSGDELWGIYIARAVDRFARWARRGLSNFAGGLKDMEEKEVPPLDILMAWHTYLLNPRVYYEDGIKGQSSLFHIRYEVCYVSKMMFD